MAPKRLLSLPQDGGEGSLPRKRWRSLVLGITRGERFVALHSPQIEFMIRRVVQEELDKVLLKYFSPSPRLPFDKDHYRHYHLVFLDNLDSPIHTTFKIEARVAIFHNDQKITSGPLSSLKVEIVVLHGDFNTENWSAEDFNANRVQERNGKGSLFKGNRVLKLVNGEASLDVAFDDNSSFTRTKTFRLGVRLIQNTGERVQEGVSNPFAVHDRRIEGSKKHHPPHLDDKVWRLEKIARDGVYCKILERSGIITVQNFLQCYVKDKDRLRQTLDKISDKYWKAIVKHAWECALGDQLYSYCLTEQNVVLVFNSIHQAVGVKVRDAYVAFDKLSPCQRVEAEKWKELAYKNMDNHPVPVTVNRTSFPGSSSLQANPSVPPPPIHNGIDQIAVQADLRQTLTIGTKFSIDLSEDGFSNPQYMSRSVSYPVEQYNPIQETSHTASLERNDLPVYSTVMWPPSPEPGIMDPNFGIQLWDYGEQATVVDYNGQAQFSCNQPSVVQTQDPSSNNDFPSAQLPSSSRTSSLDWSSFDEIIRIPSSSRTSSLDWSSFDEIIRNQVAKMTNIEPEDINRHVVPDISSFFQESDGEAGRTAGPLSPKWTVILAPVKWVLIARLSATRRARIVPPSTRTPVPTM